MLPVLVTLGIVSALIATALLGQQAVAWFWGLTLAASSRFLLRRQARAGRRFLPGPWGGRLTVEAQGLTASYEQRWDRPPRHGAVTAPHRLLGILRIEGLRDCDDQPLLWWAATPARLAHLRRRGRPIPELDALAPGERVLTGDAGVDAILHIAGPRGLLLPRFQGAAIEALHWYARDEAEVRDGVLEIELPAGLGAQLGATALLHQHLERWGSLVLPLPEPDTPANRRAALAERLAARIRAGGPPGPRLLQLEALLEVEDAPAGRGPVAAAVCRALCAEARDPRHDWPAVDISEGEAQLHGLLAGQARLFLRAAAALGPAALHRLVASRTLGLLRARALQRLLDNEADDPELPALLQQLWTGPSDRLRSLVAGRLLLPRRITVEEALGGDHGPLTRLRLCSLLSIIGPDPTVAPLMEEWLLAQLETELPVARAAADALGAVGRRRCLLELERRRGLQPELTASLDAALTRARERLGVQSGGLALLPGDEGRLSVADAGGLSQVE